MCYKLQIRGYKFEKWFLSSREEHKLRVFQNKVLRKIIGSKRKELTAWKEMYIEKLHGFYSPPKIICFIKLRRMRCKDSFGAETDRQIFLGRPRCRWRYHYDQFVWLMTLTSGGPLWIG